jgi:hypothetical protein
MTLKADLDKLAGSIANKATDKDTPFAERLDAFKALSAYYGLLLKTRSKSDEDSDEPNFADFTSALADPAEEPSNGRAAPIRSRRRHA